MSDKTWWETIKVQGGELLDTVKKLVREGNVRRIIIKQGDRTVAEFPLTAGVVGAVFAPILAAIGALAALINECSIAVERDVPTAGAPPPTHPESPGATDPPPPAEAPPPAGAESPGATDPPPPTQD
jgi:hypothetical protein